MEKALPAIPAKRYFTIGEVSDLCGVKPYVLRYWEQEFTQLKPMKRRGNRRYYQHHEVLLVRRIRELLYDQGFTISGARNRLADGAALRAPGTAGLAAERAQARVESAEPMTPIAPMTPITPITPITPPQAAAQEPRADPVDWSQLRSELRSIRALLEG